MPFGIFFWDKIHAVTVESRFPKEKEARMRNGTYFAYRSRAGHVELLWHYSRVFVRDNVPKMEKAHVRRYQRKLDTRKEKFRIIRAHV